ncbi:hypothetical protein [Reichenbachiella ulvae]|uniref:tRNA_anti-like n=1 Tax=Reichenbachiella ulvae TaxID=2980104 RepID=A0ABT3CSD7_9BACT|nr:hypothetical protein [Reichenbachiella ulvae]MCV9386615.1 hypothetical protein [Reichenbachiella ulvae]
MRKTKVLLPLIAVSVYLYVVIFIFSDQDAIDCNLKKKLMRQSFDGVVESKFIDTSNHSYKMITLLKDGRESSVNLTFFLPSIYDQIHVGDHLSKAKGSKYVSVNNRELITVDEEIKCE